MVRVKSKNKEKIHDKLISPLVKQIIEICKKNKIPMFAEFQFSKEGFCHSCIPNPKHSIFKIYLAMSQCKEDHSINIDKFLLWVCREFDNSQSVFLSKYKKTILQRSE